MFLFDHFFEVHFCYSYVQRQQSILKHFKEALKFFCMAYVLRSYKSASWGDKLVESWENSLEETCEWLALLDTTGKDVTRQIILVGGGGGAGLCDS